MGRRLARSAGELGRRRRAANWNGTPTGPPTDGAARRGRIIIRRRPRAGSSAAPLNPIRRLAPAQLSRDSIAEFRRVSAGGSAEFRHTESLRRGKRAKGRARRRRRRRRACCLRAPLSGAVAAVAAECLRAASVFPALGAPLRWLRASGDPRASEASALVIFWPPLGDSARRRLRLGAFCARPARETSDPSKAQAGIRSAGIRWDPIRSSLG